VTHGSLVCVCVCVCVCLSLSLVTGIDCDSRVAIVGPNGAGKSTMLKLLEAEVIPQTGGISRHPKLRIAKFTQHHLEMFNMVFVFCRMAHALLGAYGMRCSERMLVAHKYSRMQRMRYTEHEQRIHDSGIDDSRSSLPRLPHAAHVLCATRAAHIDDYRSSLPHLPHASLECVRRESGWSVRPRTRVCARVCVCACVRVCVSGLTLDPLSRVSGLTLHPF